jgi:capsular exopolysaccharide synthesis family protein
VGPVRAGRDTDRRGSLRSAAPGPACNLAITLAQAGVRVVLIEGDLRRPRIADYMGIEGAVGLTSVLLGRTSLEDALQPWGHGTLEVLPSGPLPPNPSELLGSASMRHLIETLEGRFDLVLIDAPPLLPVTDAAVLGTLCSGVLILIRSNVTSREQVARATATVNAVGATILGAILNMVPTRGPDAYAYGYGYGYGGDYNNTKRDKTGRLDTAEAAVSKSGGVAGVGSAAWARGGADVVDLRPGRDDAPDVVPDDSRDAEVVADREVVREPELARDHDAAADQEVSPVHRSGWGQA